MTSVSAEALVEARVMPLSKVIVNNTVISLVSCMILMLLIIKHCASKSRGVFVNFRGVFFSRLPKDSNRAGVDFCG